MRALALAARYDTKILVEKAVDAREIELDAVARNGLITHMDVWNDSAERMLLRAGLCEPWTITA